ncbi:hypothetical protein [Aquiflexum balticum]|nr:hypothetical protein [Aquiflexum balticum]
MKRTKRQDLRTKRQETRTKMVELKIETLFPAYGRFGMVERGFGRFVLL